MENLPEWIEERDDGSLAVKFDDLKRQPKIDGTDVAELRMREPTVEEQLLADKKHPHPGDAEVHLISLLTEQPRETIAGLTLKQYARLQRAYGFFTG